MEVRRRAKYFQEERLAKLEQMHFSSEKETLMEEIQAELAGLIISTLNEKSFAQRFDKAFKDMLKEQKEIQKAQVDAAIYLVDTHFEQIKASNSFVVKLPSKSSAKVVLDAIKHVYNNKKDKSVYFIGVDSVTGKVNHGCFIAQVSTLHLDIG